MGKSSAPSPPDPAATAAAQGQANTSTAAAQAALNYVNQNTPYGSTTYNQSGSYTTPNGETVPTYTENTALSPLGQTILTGQQNVAAGLLPATSMLAGQAAGAASIPLNFDSLFSQTINQGPGHILDQNPAYASTLNAGPQLLDQNVTNAIYGQESSFLNPQWNQQQTQLQDQLSRQGIPVGSDAYNNAMEQFNNAKTQAYQSAQDSAIGQGSAAAGNLFNMALTGQQQSTAQQQAGFDAAVQGQQQNVAEQQLAHTEPLQLLQSLFGATPPSPTQPVITPPTSSVAPTDVVGATASSGNQALAAYQAQLAQQNSMFGGVASLGGAAALAVAL